VAFSSFNAAGKLTVCILDLATRAEKEICEGAQAAFTGDGQGLVLRRDDQIYLQVLASGAEKLISPRMWSRCSYPSASPDGARVAMASRLLAGYNIYILPLAGGEPRLLVGGEGTCDPRWAPSGRQLSYQTESHIFTIKPDGADKLQVTFGGGVQHYACFSPDETRLAYCQGPGRDGPWQICAVSLVAEEDPAVLAKEGSNLYPEWGRLVLGGGQ
jgi:Tol biopolymer transport system component